MDVSTEIIVGRDYEDLKRFGKRGTLYLGKHLVGTGEDAHLTTPLLLDALRPHVIVICGKRGTGKSYSMGVMVEELLKLEEEYRRNLCSLIIDTQGIFWTMKSPNKNVALQEWDLNPRGFNVTVYVPQGQEERFRRAGVSYDGTFSISPGELTMGDWLGVFNLELTDVLGILLQRALSTLSQRYSIDDVIDAVGSIKGFEREKLALINYLIAAKSWGIFGEQGLPNLLEPGKASILDVSLTPQNVRTLLVSILARKIFEQRTEARRREEMAVITGERIERTPMIWIFIDEAHNFVPCEGEPVSLRPLLKIVREGRQPGITLVLATQQPNKLHPDALAQCDLIISHRLTAKSDIDALKTIMQTYVEFDITKYIEELPRVKGVCIILDDNSERLYKAQIRPRQSWHAGASPLAAKIY